MANYTVQGGDTLSGIAQKFGLPSYQGITGYASGNPGLIKPGEVLNIPGNVSAPTSAPAAAAPAPTAAPPSSSDPVAMAKQFNDYQVQANQPVIQSLQASKQPLQDRYKSLIDSIKGNQQTAENRQTVVTRNELGLRGIPLDSTLAQQGVVDAVNPITQQYTSMSGQAQASQDSELSDLMTKIAALQAGDPSGALKMAMDQISQNNANAFNDKQFNEGVREFNVSQANKSSGNTDLVKTLADLRKSLGLDDNLNGGVAGASTSSGANNSKPALDSFVSTPAPTTSTYSQPINPGATVYNPVTRKSEPANNMTLNFGDLPGLRTKY